MLTGHNYEQLAHRAYLFLERQGGRTSEEALIREVFQVRAGSKSEIWGGILAQVLADPHRFRRTTGGEWCLTVQTDTNCSLLDLEYVVLDCETTGLHPQKQRITEVAAIKVRSGQRIETFESLINPHRRIPDYITSLTGISSEMTATAPGFGKIAPKLREFIGSAIIVGHNIPFDIRFLDYELRRIQLPPLLNETIDTISLALRLHPGMKRPNLDRLAALVGIPVSNRHRAYGDASITAEAFLILLNQAIEKGYNNLTDLRNGKALSKRLSVVSNQSLIVSKQLAVSSKQSLISSLAQLETSTEPETLNLELETKISSSITMFEMALPGEIESMEVEVEQEEGAVRVEQAGEVETSEGEGTSALAQAEVQEGVGERPTHLPRRPRYRPEAASLTNRATARARHVLSKELIRDLPAKPGVYLMKDNEGQVIYVGKAKNLHDRVSSYYSQPLGYTRKMDGLIESIIRIDHIVTGSELEALLLESKLIKRYLPRYNRQQRNFESYPFIKIDLSQRFPRIYRSREVEDDGARYFGPFKSRRAVDTTIEIIEQLFPIRNCTRSFELITLARKRKPESPCLRLPLGRCPGPCTGKHSDIDQKAYLETIEEVISFLSGEKQTMLDTLWQQIQKAAQLENFERAASLRDAYQQVEKIIGSQKFLAAAVEHNNILIILPSAQPGAAEVLCIYRGRLGRQVRLKLADTSPELAADSLANTWQELIKRESELTATQPGWGRQGGRVIGQEAVDEINIIARWLYAHSDRTAEEQLIVGVPALFPDPSFWLNTVTQIRNYSPLSCEGSGS